jgi:hypothetical protein
MMEEGAGSRGMAKNDPKSENEGEGAGLVYNEWRHWDGTKSRWRMYVGIE